MRDIAGGVVERAAEPPATSTAAGDRPAGIEELMTTLVSADEAVTVQEVAPSRFIAFLPGPHSGNGRRLRLVGGDHTAYADQAVRDRVAVSDGAVDEAPRVMLVGCAQGGGPHPVVGRRRRAADAATHPELRDELERMRGFGTWAARPSERAAQRRSCTNSPSWVRLRHSTMGTTSA